MSDSANAVAIRILDKEYMVACPAEERAALLTSARYLDERMRETRDGGKVLGTERMAVMTALNIVHELLLMQQEKEDAERAIAEHVKELETRIETALGRRMDA